MASASKQGALYRFEWRDPHTGESHRVGLSGLNKRQADQIKGWIQDLADSMKSGTPAPVEAAGWLLRLPPAIHAKFAEAGLAPTRKARGLEAFALDFIEGKRDTVSPATIFRYEIATREVCAFFGKGRDIATITVGDALAFHAWLQKPRKRADAKTGEEVEVRGLTGSTPNKRCEDVSVMLTDAKRHRLIQENPFADRAVPKASKPAPEEKRMFVEEADALRIMEEMPHPEMRALFAFARWAGTRQREPLGMKWEHVHFGNGTKEDPGHILIPCDKTAKKTGKAFRKSPLFREVERELLALQEGQEAGEEWLFPHYRAQGLNATTAALLKGMKRAGVDYPAPWQNLRRTRATELKEAHPDFAVEEWMGHTEKVANAHYRRASAAMFAAAIAGPESSGGGGGGAVSKTAESLAKARAEAVAIVEAKTRKIPEENAKETKSPPVLKVGQSRGTWIPTTPEFHGKSDEIGNPVGAGVGEACQNLPQDCETPPGLAEVIEAWNHLPEAIRAGILAMVKASTVEAFR